MSLDYIRERYQVPATIGRFVTVDGEPGVIVGAKDARLRVQMSRDGFTVSAHPTWRVDYDPQAVCEYRPTTGYRCTLPAGHPTLEPHHVERTTNLHTCPTCTRKVALVTGNTIETHTAPGHPYGPVCPTSGQLLDETHGGAL